MRTQIKLDAIVETRLAEAPREKVFVVVPLGDSMADAAAGREPSDFATAVRGAQVHGDYKPFFVSAQANLGIVQSDGTVVFPDRSEPDRDAFGVPRGPSGSTTCPMCEGRGKRISIETGRRDESCGCQNGRVVACR